MRIRFVFFLAVSLAFITLAMCSAPARQPVVGTGDALAYLPGESLGFIHLEGKALWNSPVLDELQKRLSPDIWKKFEQTAFQDSEKITGIARKNIRSVTFVLDTFELPQMPGWAVLISSSAPINRANYIKGIKAGLPERVRNNAGEGSVKYEGIELSEVASMPGQPMVAGLLLENMAAVGDLETVKKLINRRKEVNKSGILAAAIKNARGHDMAIGLQIPEAMQNQLHLLMDTAVNGRNVQRDADFMYMLLGMDLLKSLIDMKHMQLQLDIKHDLGLHVAVEANNEKAAVRFQRMLDLGALFGDFGFKHLNNMTQLKGYAELSDFRKLFTLMSEALGNSKVVRQGNQVEMNVTAAGGGPELMSAASTAFTRIVLVQDRVFRQNNLRQIAIAMHNYHNDYNRLPSPATYQGNTMLPRPGGNNKPYFSWRVAILPYLESDNLYKQFHFDEPWDSEHNKKLIPLMPKCYSCPGAPDPGSGKTYLQVFVAPEKPANMNKQKFAPIFQYGKPGITLGQLTVQDGTSNTFMIAESANAVIWTKPEDMLMEDDDTPLPKLGCNPDEDDFLVVFGDASVRSIRKTLEDKKQYERLMRQLIGRRDGMNEDPSPIMK